MVKIGGKQTNGKLSQKNVNFAEIGEIYKFCENRGDMQYASLA